MSEIINLLKEKNTCLEKFYDLNQKEIESITAGNFDNLETFYNSREGILSMIRKMDEMIDIASLDFQESEESKNKEITKEISIALNMRDRIIEQILEQDLEILSTIDDVKSQIIRDLAQSKMTRKAVGSYKSGIQKQKVSQKA